MKTESTKEQTKRLIQLGCPAPPEVENWQLDTLTQDYLAYYDKDNCIHVLRNYTLSEVLDYFISVGQNKKYKVIFDGFKWSMETNEETIKNKEYIDLLIDGIEKLMEGR